MMGSFTLLIEILLGVASFPAPAFAHSNDQITNTWWELLQTDDPAFDDYRDKKIYLNSIELDEQSIHSCYEYAVVNSYGNRVKYDTFCYPAVIVTGIRKSGTNALYRLIASDPLVQVGAQRENCPFAPEQSILQFFSSLPKQMSDGKLLLDGCTDLISNMKIRKLLRNPNTFYVVSIRDYTDWAWSIYNSVCTIGYDSDCDPITREIIPRTHKRSPYKFHGLVMAEANNRAKESPLDFGELCRYASYHARDFVLELWDSVPVENTLVLSTEEMLLNPVATWNKLSSAIGFAKLNPFVDEFAKMLYNTRFAVEKELVAKSYNVVQESAPVGMVRMGKYKATDYKLVWRSSREILNRCWGSNCMWSSIVTDYNMSACQSNPFNASLGGYPYTLNDLPNFDIMSEEGLKLLAYLGSKRIIHGQFTAALGNIEDSGIIHYENTQSAPAPHAKVFVPAKASYPFMKRRPMQCGSLFKSAVEQIQAAMQRAETGAHGSRTQSSLRTVVDKEKKEEYLLGGVLVLVLSEAASMLVQRQLYFSTGYQNIVNLTPFSPTPSSVASASTSASSGGSTARGDGDSFGGTVADGMCSQRVPAVVLASPDDVELLELREENSDNNNNNNNNFGRSGHGRGLSNVAPDVTIDHRSRKLSLFGRSSSFFSSTPPPPKSSKRAPSMTHSAHTTHSTHTPAASASSSHASASTIEKILNKVLASQGPPASSTANTEKPGVINASSSSPSSSQQQSDDFRLVDVPADAPKYLKLKKQRADCKGKQRIFKKVVVVMDERFLELWNQYLERARQVQTQALGRSSGSTTIADGITSSAGYSGKPSDDDYFVFFRWDNWERNAVKLLESMEEASTVSLSDAAGGALTDGHSTNAAAAGKAAAVASIGKWTKEHSEIVYSISSANRFFVRADELQYADSKLETLRQLTDFISKALAEDPHPGVSAATAGSSNLLKAYGAAAPSAQLLTYSTAFVSFAQQFGGSSSAFFNSDYSNMWSCVALLSQTDYSSALKYARSRHEMAVAYSSSDMFCALMQHYGYNPLYRQALAAISYEASPAISTYTSTTTRSTGRNQQRNRQLAVVEGTSERFLTSSSSSSSSGIGSGSSSSKSSGSPPSTFGPVCNGDRSATADKSRSCKIRYDRLSFLVRNDSTVPAVLISHYHDSTAEQIAQQRIAITSTTTKSSNISAVNHIFWNANANVRRLIEHSTGAYSGSTKTEAVLLNQFPGERFCSKQVSVLKSYVDEVFVAVAPRHRAAARAAASPTVSATIDVVSTFAKKCSKGGASDIQRALIMLRDPYVLVWKALLFGLTANSPSTASGAAGDGAQGTKEYEPLVFQPPLEVDVSRVSSLISSVPYGVLHDKAIEIAKSYKTLRNMYFHSSLDDGSYGPAVSRGTGSESDSVQSIQEYSSSAGGGEGSASPSLSVNNVLIFTYEALINRYALPTVGNSGSSTVKYGATKFNEADGIEENAVRISNLKRLLAFSGFNDVALDRMECAYYFVDDAGARAQLEEMNRFFLSHVDLLCELGDMFDSSLSPSGSLEIVRLYKDVSCTTGNS